MLFGWKCEVVLVKMTLCRDILLWSFVVKCCRKASRNWLEMNNIGEWYIAYVEGTRITGRGTSRNINRRPKAIAIARRLKRVCSHEQDRILDKGSFLSYDGWRISCLNLSSGCRKYGLQTFFHDARVGGLLLINCVAKRLHVRSHQ